MVFRECPVCGLYFEGKSSKKFCSKKCKDKARYLEIGSRKIVTCLNPKCAAAFFQRVPAQKYCSTVCKRQHEHGMYMASKECVEKTCVRAGCNTTFIGDKKRKYCCSACAELTKRERDHERLRDKS